MVASVSVDYILLEPQTAELFLFLKDNSIVYPNISL